MLIKKFPDLARIVLNRSISFDHSSERPDDMILNFEFIDDLYRVNLWSQDCLKNFDSTWLYKPGRLDVQAPAQAVYKSCVSKNDQLSVS